MTLCYLSLGSNLNYPIRQLRRAVRALQHHPNLALLTISSIYLSQPLGVKAQPPFYNLVLSLNTRLCAQQLLSICQEIENKQHRIRKTHWGARTLDIDILLYGMHTIHERNLQIPHPQMLMRDFVMLPLLEIAPNICLPHGRERADWLKAAQRYLIRRI